MNIKLLVILAWVLALGSNQFSFAADNNAANQSANNNANNSNSSNAVKNSNNKSNNENNADEYFDDGGGNNAAVSSGEVEDQSITGLTHPSAASRWRTQELIMQARMPAFEQIQACQTELSALADKSINQEAMLENRILLTQSVKKSTEIYHWCFYMTMLQLDQKLDSLDTKITFLNKYQNFIGQMKILWLLSRSLDAALGSKKYFGYIRVRYIELMKQHFGRDVTSISAPLGDNSRKVNALPPKPAATDPFTDY